MANLEHVECRLVDGRCQLYLPGHNMHAIQAKRIGQAPWGWRDAVVLAIDGLSLQLRYVAEDVVFAAWHHADLSEWLEPGTPVRVSQSAGSVLQGSLGQVCLATDSPLDAVPEPEDLEAWKSRMSWGVVDLATGRGVNLDGEFDE